ncbi:MAG TPA: DUF1674 domain-containing protein [Stellaceae bacterium]|nr:DUF1674 domain-containing protein [Stellaceae bacterium]
MQDTPKVPYPPANPVAVTPTAPTPPALEKVADEKPCTGEMATGQVAPGEVGGPKGPEPTRFGDWERNGRCTDF